MSPVTVNDPIICLKVKHYDMKPSFETEQVLELIKNIKRRLN